MFYNKEIAKRTFSFKGKYWYKNIKNIPLYFKLINHLVTKGYDEYATWETFDWFIHTMKSILTDYKKSHWGYPITDFNLSDEENEKVWENNIDTMLSLLDDMDEENEKYQYEGEYDLERDKCNHAARVLAKNKFFELFSKSFYDLWD